MDGRMQGLDATVHNFWKTRHFGNVGHRNSGRCERLCRAASGDQNDTSIVQRAGKFREACLVGY